MPALTFAEFQAHSNRGGKKAFLKSWKDKDPYSITVWLHTQASILAMWRHRYLRVVRKEVAGKPTVEIWSNPLVCWEDEEVLQDQNFYDRDTLIGPFKLGLRQQPPQICPHCIMLDWIHNEIRAGHLDWREPLFRYACDDASKTVTLHAGGMCGLFNNKKLTDEQKKEMIEIPRERGGPVYQRGQSPNVAFKQDSKAKLEYAFAIVDANDVGKGVQIAVESNLLGEKVREVVANTKKSVGPERGDIQTNPYAIQFEHNPAEGIPFDKKYSALRMEMTRLTPMIKKLIMDDPPPDMSSLGERFDPATHQANLERQALARLPFESFFAKAKAAWKARPPKEAGKEPERGTRVPDVGRPLPPPPAAEENPDEEVRCGNVTAAFPATANEATSGCPNVMKMRDPKCSMCGKVYLIEADPLPLPPPMRSRATMNEPTHQAPASNAGEGDDEIPF